jgi:hypothetical protein
VLSKSNRLVLEPVSCSRFDLGLTFLTHFSTFNSALITEDAVLNPSLRGAVAQLGERLNGIQEVEGSIPFGSTNSINDFHERE